MDTITLPKLGQTMEKATIEKWHVKEGDTISKGDIVVEITTDKATLEVESYVSGTVRKLVAAEGEEKNVGGIIALVGDPNEEIPDISKLEKTVVPEVAAPKTEAEAPSAVSAPEKGVPAKVGRVRATPRAKKLARELGVDLSTVKGSGRGGRITEGDVKAQTGEAAPAAAAPAKAPLPEGIQKKPLSAMRRVIAERLTKSSQEAPHFYLTIEVDMTDIVSLRGKLRPEHKPSYNDILIETCAVAMKEMPDINATWAADGVGLRDSIDIGLAVSIDDGLMVPVIRGADRKSLMEIAKQSVELIKKARSKKLTPDEYGNSSMTISNLGMFGIESFMPVINLGESVILGVGSIQEKAVVKGGEICICQMMTLTLSCDHRIVDGVLGAQFLSRIKELLEGPKSI